MLLALSLSTGAWQTREAPASLGGTWELGRMGGHFPLGFPGARGICNLPAAPVKDAHGPSEEDSEQLRSIGNLEGTLTITQSAAAITIERRYGGSIGQGTYRTEVTLDGKERTAVAHGITSRSRARWDGGGLVVDHLLTWNSQSRGESCAVRETFSLEGGRTLFLTAVNEAAGTRSRQRYTRK